MELYSIWIQLNQKKTRTYKNSTKKNFINRLKYGEHKIFCICVDVYKIYEGDDFDQFFEVLSTFKKN